MKLEKIWKWNKSSYLNEYLPRDILSYGQKLTENNSKTKTLKSRSVYPKSPSNIKQISSIKLPFTYPYFCKWWPGHNLNNIMNDSQLKTYHNAKYIYLGLNTNKKLIA